jgi:hypothetical protein
MLDNDNDNDNENEAHFGRATELFHLIFEPSLSATSSTPMSVEPSALMARSAPSPDSRR